MYEKTSLYIFVLDQTVRTLLLLHLSSYTCGQSIYLWHIWRMLSMSISGLKDRFTFISFYSFFHAFSFKFLIYIVKTCAQLTDCDKTWKYCIVPILTLPVTFQENCSLCGNKYTIAPTEEELENKKLEEMTKDIANTGFSI